MARNTEVVGLNTSIVSALRKYGHLKHAVLADLVGRQSSEINEPLRRLNEKGVVRQDNDKVELVEDQP